MCLRPLHTIKDVILSTSANNILLFEFRGFELYEYMYWLTRKLVTNSNTFLLIKAKEKVKKLRIIGVCQTILQFCRKKEKVELYRKTC